MGERPALRNGLLAVLVLYSLFHLGYSVARYNPFTNPSVSGDFDRALREAGEVRREWREDRTLLGGGKGYDVVHPLPYYVALWPFLDWGEEKAGKFFFAIQFLLFPLAILFLVWSVAGRSAAWADYVLAFALAANFQPFLETLSQHKVEGIEFFLLCGAILALARKRDLLGGALICTAAALKYLPAVLLFFLLVKRKYRALLGFLGAGIGILALLVIGFGMDHVRPLVAQQSARMMWDTRVQSNQQIGYIEFQSVNGAVNRLFSAPGAGRSFQEVLLIGTTNMVNPQIAYVVSLILKILLTAAALFFLWPKKGNRLGEGKEGGDLYLLELSVGLSMLVVFIQGVRLHYAVLLLPAYVLTGLILYRRRRQLRINEALLFLFSYLMGGIGIPAGMLQLLPENPLWGKLYLQAYRWYSFPLLGYLLLGGAAVLCHRRLRLAEAARGVIHER